MISRQQPTLAMVMLPLDRSVASRSRCTEAPAREITILPPGDITTPSQQTLVSPHTTNVYATLTFANDHNTIFITDQFSQFGIMNYLLSSHFILISPIINLTLQPSY